MEKESRKERLRATHGILFSHRGEREKKILKERERETKKNTCVCLHGVLLSQAKYRRKIKRDRENEKRNK